MGWYKLVDRVPVLVDLISNPEEAELLQGSDRRLHKTILPNGNVVSTVFLSLDHSFGNGRPVLFETMVFPSNEWYELDQARYCTWDEAVDGHWVMVTKHGGTKPLTKEQCEFKMDEELFNI